jgi:hypothetical protein
VLVVAVQVLDREALEVGLGADDVLAQGALGPQGAAGDGVGVHQAAVLVELVEALFDDDGALGLDAVEDGAVQEVGEQARAGGELVGVEPVAVAAGLPRGPGVEGGAHALRAAVDLVGVGHARTPLEDHVLEEVRKPMILRGFVA